MKPNLKNEYMKQIATNDLFKTLAETCKNNNYTEDECITYMCNFIEKTLVHNFYECNDENVNNLFKIIGEVYEQ